jgi:hypothetical protein
MRCCWAALGGVGVLLFLRLWRLSRLVLGAAQLVFLAHGGVYLVVCCVNGWDSFQKRSAGPHSTVESIHGRMRV